MTWVQCDHLMAVKAPGITQNRCLNGSHSFSTQICIHKHCTLLGLCNSCWKVILTKTSTTTTTAAAAAVEGFTKYSFIRQCLIQPSLVTRSPGKVKNIVSLIPEGCTAHLKYIYKTEQYFIVRTNQTQERDKKKKRKLSHWAKVRWNISVLFTKDRERERVFGGQYGFVIFTFYLKRKWSTVLLKDARAFLQQSKEWCFSAPDSELGYSRVDCSLQSRQHSAENRPWASILEPLIQIKTPTSNFFHYFIACERNIIFQQNVIILGVA